MNLLVAWLLTIVVNLWSADAAPVNATIASTPSFTLSPLLAGLHVVYCWAPSDIYSNGTVATWARSHGVNTARFPGGTASYWNWEDPSGIMGQSTLDPKWNGTRAPTDEWMSLDEYLDFATDAKLMPFVGVNYVAVKEYSRPLNASLAAAQRQVAAVVAKGFPGAYYYIGNEDGSKAGGLSESAALVKLHADAMKQVDPKLTVFFNCNDISPSQLKTYLGIAGGSVDGVEYHGKWPFGGTPPHVPPRTYNDWLNEVPLQDHKANITWRTRNIELRQAATEAGYPELLFSNNEYGLGKENVLVNFTRYSKSLVVVEFAMELFIGNYTSSAFWDTAGSVFSDQMLIDQKTGNRFNPSHFGLAMLFESAGELYYNLTTSERRVHGFCAAAPHAATTTCYIINKLEEAAIVAFTGQDCTSVHVASLVDTDDHWGTVQTTSLANCDNISLPAVSFTKLEIEH